MSHFLISSMQIFFSHPLAVDGGDSVSIMLRAVCGSLSMMFFMTQLLESSQAVEIA
jgi:hypothetical protein